MAKKNEHFRSPSFLKKLQNRDKTAISEVVNAYTTHLYKAGLGMGISEEKVQDICHNTWATFFEILPRFEGRSHVRTFLFGIFYNKCSEAYRQNGRFEKADPIEEVMESRFAENDHWSNPISEPERYVNQSQMIDIIEKCLEGLPVQQKAAFYLKVVEEKSTQEVCNILEVTNTNLRQLLYRGKNRLRECVEKSAGL
ncbi:MAG: hypothetical protein CME70_17185 [Halobacteriovorax sp.]|nr:hypothetical protein [Halobacteriovorax sp.]|tara:strand:+ start:99861 stop:100451 length:591 start_codon:yes stop_codon:yes gene_type:complete